MSKTSKEDFFKYRIDILENKILNLEKRLDSIVPHSNNNNINMELLQMVMSMVKQPVVENKVTCVKEIPHNDEEKKEPKDLNAFNLRRRSTVI